MRSTLRLRSRKVVNRAPRSSDLLRIESIWLVNGSDNRAKLDRLTFLRVYYIEHTIVRRFDLDVYLVGFHFDQSFAFLQLFALGFSQRRIHTSSLSSLDPKRGMMTSLFIVGGQELAQSE